MTIEWNKVTKFSQGVAIVLFVGVFALGFWIGALYQAGKAVDTVPAGPMPVEADGKISDVSYACSAGKEIHAVFYADKVTIMLSDGRTFNLPHVISGSGARYANDDESVVFWEKGATSFITEGKETTYADCNEAPIPE